MKTKTVNFNRKTVRKKFKNEDFRELEDLRVVRLLKITKHQGNLRTLEKSVLKSFNSLLDWLVPLIRTSN